MMMMMMMVMVMVRMRQGNDQKDENDCIVHDNDDEKKMVRER